jgi:outer membrane protein OmpA-like peptidoglycan-associated protein
MLSAVLLTGGVLLSAPIDRATPTQDPLAYSPTLFDAAQFSVQFGRDRLHIAGTSASAEHETALLQLASEHFPGVQVTTEFRAALRVPPDWETLSTRLLYLVAATDSATALLDAAHITIRGVSVAGPVFENRRQFLQNATAEHRSVHADMLVLNPETEFGSLCDRSFADFASEPIRFRLSSTDIRQSSYPLLDKVAEFTHDCGARKVAIIGHSDATGSGAWNVQISRARAEAVAAQLMQRGVARNRLIIEGRGAAHPVADNETVHGREQNRRSELELR